MDPGWNLLYVHSSIYPKPCACTLLTSQSTWTQVFLPPAASLLALRQIRELVQGFHVFLRDGG